MSRSLPVELVRQMHREAWPERMPVSWKTFRRLPRAVRDWYAIRAQIGGTGARPELQWYATRKHAGGCPTELAVRCLVNDFLYAAYKSGGYKSVDGWKAQRAA